MKIEFEDYEKAYELISSLLPPTPLVRNDWLSNKYGANIFLKLESLQPVGSFKCRGAANKIYNLSEEEKKRGVVAMSAGNHAQGVAWAAQKLGVEATIVMPKLSPIIKVANTEAMGAKVILEGENVDESFQFVKKYLEKHNKVLVHPYHDAQVIAGQGTIAFELKKQLEEIDYIVGAIGGGGMLAGIGQVMKRLHASVQIIGAQAQGANTMVRSIQEGRPVYADSVATFADGIKIKDPQPDLLALLSEVVDESLDVSDDMTALALLELMEQGRIVTEGAGAVPLAAFDQLYQKDPERFKGKNIVLVICGGNIDINLVDRIIEKGLQLSHRRIKVDVLLDDRPGSLFEFTGLIKELGGNILQVTHERNAPYLELQESIVEAVLETKGKAHSDEILSKLGERFKFVRRNYTIEES